MEYSTFLSHHEHTHTRQCSICRVLWPKFYEYHSVLLEKDPVDTARAYIGLDEMTRIQLAGDIDKLIHCELVKLIPRRIPSAYQLYLKHCKQPIYSTAPAKWTQLTAEEKQTFIERAVQLRRECKRKLALLTPNLNDKLRSMRRQPNRRLPPRLQEIVLNYTDDHNMRYKTYLKTASDEQKN